MINKFANLRCSRAERQARFLTIALNLFVCSVVAPPLAGAQPFGIGAAGHFLASCSDESAKQGQTVSVDVKAVGPHDKAEPPPVVTFNGKTYKTFLVPKSEMTEAEIAGNGDDYAPIYRALVSVPALLKPGLYRIDVTKNSSIPLTVVPGGFGVQRLSLPPGKDNFISSPGEEATVQKGRETVSDEKLWSGVFMRPSPARISSTYGLRRIVNGKMLPDYFHSGIDYAGSVGSPVKATQRGRVIIARTGWRLHGGTVAIDHGHGLVSFYIHLSKVLVEENQMVKAGQEIGKVGSTGRASGPHLHFSLYCNGNATNPNNFYTKAFR